MKKILITNKLDIKNDFVQHLVKTNLPDYLIVLNGVNSLVFDVHPFEHGFNFTQSWPVKVEADLYGVKFGNTNFLLTYEKLTKSNKSLLQFGNLAKKYDAQVVISYSGEQVFKMRNNVLVLGAQILQDNLIGQELSVLMEVDDHFVDNATLSRYYHSDAGVEFSKRVVLQSVYGSRAKLPTNVLRTDDVLSAEEATALAGRYNNVHHRDLTHLYNDHLITPLHLKEEMDHDAKVENLNDQAFVQTETLHERPIFSDNESKNGGLTEVVYEDGALEAEHVDVQPSDKPKSDYELDPEYVALVAGSDDEASKEVAGVAPATPQEEKFLSQEYLKTLSEQEVVVAPVEAPVEEPVETPVVEATAVETVTAEEELVPEPLHETAEATTMVKDVYTEDDVIKFKNLSKLKQAWVLFVNKFKVKWHTFKDDYPEGSDFPSSHADHQSEDKKEPAQEEVTTKTSDLPQESFEENAKDVELFVGEPLVNVEFSPLNPNSALASEVNNYNWEDYVKKSGLDLNQHVVEFQALEADDDKGELKISYKIGLDKADGEHKVSENVYEAVVGGFKVRSESNDPALIDFCPLEWDTVHASDVSVNNWKDHVKVIGLGANQDIVNFEILEKDDEHGKLKVHFGVQEGGKVFEDVYERTIPGFKVKELNKTYTVEGEPVDQNFYRQSLLTTLRELLVDCEQVLIQFNQISKTENQYLAKFYQWKEFAEANLLNISFDEQSENNEFKIKNDQLENLNAHLQTIKDEFTLKVSQLLNIGKRLNLQSLIANKEKHLEKVLKERHELIEQYNKKTKMLLNDVESKIQNVWDRVES